MKKVLLIIGILLLFVIAALAGYYVWSMNALSTEENIQTFVIEPVQRYQSNYHPGKDEDGTGGSGRLCRTEPDEVASVATTI